MEIHFKKSIKKNVCLLFLFFTTISIYSQTTIPKRAKLKTLIYSDYSILGYVYKKQFVNGQDVTIKSLKTNDTIISGNYFTDNNFGFINGVWKRNSTNGITYAKGLFVISNSNNVIGLNTKTKESDSLQIKTESISYYKGFRNTKPAFLEKLPNNNYSLIIDYSKDNDKKSKNKIVKLELEIDKPLIKKYGFYSIDDFLFYTPNVKQTFSNGDVFIGVLDNLSTDENNAIKYNRKEGKFIYSKGPLINEELIKQNNGNYMYRCIYSESGNNVFEKLELNINKKDIEKYGFWATSKYIENIEDVKYTYRNGNVFIGKVENTFDSNTDGISSKLTDGLLKYPTGETFQGNISGQWYCGIPISGEITLSNGNIKKGNWLKKFDLTQAEYNKVLKVESPTKKLSLAQKLYIEREYTNSIDNAKLAISYENYSKAKGWFKRALKLKPNDSEYLNSQIDKVDELLKKQARKKELIKKYGQYYGSKIANGELVLGMSQEIVNEYYPKKYFNISYINRNNNKIIVWEFDKQKMQNEIMKDGKKKGEEEGALAFLLMLNLADSMGMGEMEIPQMLMFTNNELTDIYNY